VVIVCVTSLITLTNQGVNMLKVTVMRLDKNGNMQEYTLKMKDTRNNNLELEKLAELAEEFISFKEQSWK
jgi:hypothetical protein